MRHEQRYGSFTRVLPLPEGVTEADVKASYVRRNPGDQDPGASGRTGCDQDPDREDLTPPRTVARVERPGHRRAERWRDRLIGLA